MANFVLIHGAWVSHELAHSSDAWDGHWLAKARNKIMNTGHDAMISAPTELADILFRCA